MTVGSEAPASFDDRLLSVEAAAAEAPSRPFLVDPDGRGWSYRQTAHRVCARGEALAAAGIVGDGPAERFVGFVARPTVPGLITALTLLEKGIPFVLLHPALTASERRAILGRNRITKMVPDILPISSPAEVSSVSSSAGISRVSSPTGRTPRAGAPTPGTGRAAVAFVTSGTTGAPKVVVHRRGGLVASARASAENLGWTPQDRWLLSTPIAHVAGFSVLIRCLIARRTVVLARSGASDAFVDAVERYGVTLASLVPTQLGRLLEDRPSWRPPRTLRAILLGGAPAAPQLVTRARDAGYPVFKTYGLTEAGSQVATERFGGRPSPPGTVGPPLDGVEVRIDGERILVRGPMLMRGFLGGSRGGMEADGWYDTGDRGCLTDTGVLEVWGRGAEMIVSGGENVFPAEVEAVLCSLETVRDAVVFGVEDPKWGQVVTAAVVFADGRRETWSGLQRRSAERLARFKLPRRWVEMPAFDRLPSGKVDRVSVRRAARLHLATAACSTLTGGGDDDERLDHSG